PAVVASRCTSCGECVEICPTDAITLQGEAGRGRLPGQIGDLEDARVDHSSSSSDQGSGGGTDGTFGTPGEGEPTA
ncbi:MAG TPA: 4Fe-4S binding protein, partial [Pseudonocardiaceae bacterium]